MQISNNVPMNPELLLQYADDKQLEGAREDKKSHKASRSSAFKNQVDSAKDSVKAQRDASDERHAAAKKKTNGGFWGAIVGIAIAVAVVVAVVATALTAGMAAPLAAAIIGLGVAAMSTGSTLGSLIGNKTAEGNEKRANEKQELADSMKVDEKSFEKMSEEYKDSVDGADELYDQILDARRQRSQEKLQAPTSFRA